MSHSSVPTRATILSLTGAIAIGFAGAAPAQPPSVVVQGEPQTVVHSVVRYGDLNLSEQRGRDKLVKRVRYTIDDMCDQHDDYFSALGLPDRDCVSSGWASAQPQLDQVLSRGASSLTAASIVISVRR
jgi:UrcA family protein